MKPVRVPLYGFPDVVLHADESSVKRHPQYQAAKAGDITAADLLVAELANQEREGELRAFLEGHAVELVPIHALESAGVNEIPAALARRLSAWLGFPINDSIVQTNTVGHTGASGFQRLANQALFAGEVKPQQRYLIVDDFVGQGGTLANLIGLITSRGGHVVAATVLTGKPYSAKLAPDDSLIGSLRSMDRTLKTGGGKHSGSATTVLPGRKLVTSKTPRMLTPSEIDLLRQDLKAALSHPMPRVSR